MDHWTVPHGFDAEKEKDDPQSIGHHLSRRVGKAKRGEKMNGDGAESIPTHQVAQPLRPMRSRLIGNRYDPKPFGICEAIGSRRCKEEIESDECEPEDHHREQVTDNDFADERRPVEGKEETKAPQRKCEHVTRAP